MIRPVKICRVVAVFVVASGLAASAQRGPQLVLSQLTWFSRAGAPLGKLGPLADHGNLEISPDGSKVAVAVMDQSKGTRDLWIYDTGTGARSRFTTDVAEENWMIWSPNGQRVALNRFVPGLSRLLESPVSAAMPIETLQLGEGGAWPVSWSPDGRAILYVTNSRETSNDIWVLPVGGAKPYPFQQTPASENWAAFSPDGRWVAFSSTASRTSEVFVTRFLPEARRGASRRTGDRGKTAAGRQGGSSISPRIGA
jgi:dipeptidyl aminopeptidase/acylaminoacyl peptidase